MERKEWGDVAGNEEQGSNTPKREKKKEAMEKESTEYRNNLNVCLVKKNKKNKNWLALEK